MRELGPSIAGQRRLCARPENEETHWRSLHSKILYFRAAAGPGRVKSVSQSYEKNQKNISESVREQ